MESLSKKPKTLSTWPWSLEGQSFVVTGGTKGIGLATVKALLRHGASRIICCSRSPMDSQLLQELQALSDTASIHHVVCDVATQEGRTTLVEQTQQILQGARLQGLINNVGINIRKPMLEQSDEEFHNILQTNVTSTYMLCKAMYPLLVGSSSSSSKDDTSTSLTTSCIVNVSSAAGVQSSGTGIAYGMSKAAMNQLTKTLACEWARVNIRVNAVTPWMTLTPMLQDALHNNNNNNNRDAKQQLDKVCDWTPMGRLSQPQEVAEPIVFLATHAASSYITGQCLGIDGGLTAQGFQGPCVSENKE